jgi:Flp pilus assembly protein TadG
MRLIPSSPAERFRVLARRIRGFRDDRSAQVAMIAALAAVPMVLAAGVAIDYSRAANARSDLQAAVDAAVLAGARDGSSAWATIAGKVFAASAKTADLAVVASSFTQDASGNYVGAASGSVTTSFANLMAVSSLPVAVSATAVVKTASDNICILLLSTSATPGLLLNSGATINAPNCQVHVKSTANPAATFNAGTTLATKKTCVAGATVIDNGGSHSSLSKSCATASDPFAGTLPTPASSTCTQSNLNINGGSITLAPGVYCGWTNFNASPTVTLQSGVYVIKGGGWNFSGTLTGSGVTFYFPDTSYIQFNGTVSLNLAAPTSGTYANLLMYEASGLAKSGFSMNATNGATLKGLMYLPSRQLTLNSGASVASQSLTMVLDTLTVNTANWSLDTSSKTIAAAGASGTAGIYLKP